MNKGLVQVVGLVQANAFFYLYISRPYYLFHFVFALSMRDI